MIYPDSSHAVHVSGAAWANDELRAGVMDLIDRGLIDTVELDLKDEAGVVSYDSELPKASEIGAVTGRLRPRRGRRARSRARASG